jgi:5-methylcytosine-specific restriction protein A
MKTYLFVWNPNRWTWDTLDNEIEEVNKTGNCSESWSCGVNKSIHKGDRAFLIRVGVEPKGIMGAGFVSSEPFIDRHWSGDNREALYVDIDFEAILHPEKEPILSLDLLKLGKLGTQNWTPQASGISIRTELVEELEALWFNFLATQNIRQNPFAYPQGDVSDSYTEGTPNQVLQTKYERNPFARKVCIEHYGTACTVCNFNFEDVYGELGKGFIHVHHLTQIAKVGKQHKVDPLKDLRPVCPNCHAMLHRRKEGLSIEELRSLLVKEK